MRNEGRNTMIYWRSWRKPERLRPGSFLPQPRKLNPVISSMVKFTSSENVRLFPLEKYLFLSRQVQTRITNLEPSLAPCHKNRHIWRVASCSCVVQNEKGKWSEGHKQQLVTSLLLLYILNSLSCIWTRGGTWAYSGFKQLLDFSSLAPKMGFFS